uniref:Putative retrotransposon gag domain-containing protein n=1 Tax=Helianthus annuus TaxID=4232 RepID=A0A251UYX9_HELAN
MNQLFKSSFSSISKPFQSHQSQEFSPQAAGPNQIRKSERAKVLPAKQAVNKLASSLEDTKQAVNKLCVQVGLLAKQRPLNDAVFSCKTTSYTGSPGSSSFSIFGQHKPAPINLPRFVGSHLERWVAQANRYFDFYNIPTEERLLIASFYLDEAAADWYDWLERHARLSTWPAFTAAIIQRFRVKTLEQPEGLLAKLQQTSTVEDYRQCFEEISNRTTVALPQEFLISCFISGRRSDIKQSVLIHNPVHLEEAMEKAQLHENRINMEWGAGLISLGSGKPILPTPKVTPTPSVASVIPPISNPKFPNTMGFRRLSPTELAQKKSLGLCFHCDEKYTSDQMSFGSRTLIL